MNCLHNNNFAYIDNIILVFQKLYKKWQVIKKPKTSQEACEKNACLEVLVFFILTFFFYQFEKPNKVFTISEFSGRPNLSPVSFHHNILVILDST